MSDANLRQIRVLHIVSAGGVASSLQPSLFMPLLTRLPRQRVKAQVACLSPGAVPSAVLRQNGVPTFDLALSRKRFSPKAFQELLLSTRHFRPDVIQAWGHTAQIVSALLRKRCDWKPRLVWSICETTPLARNAGLIDRQKLKYAAKFSARADRVIYTSESGAAQHRRCGFPDGGHETISPGVDATRFKPDFAARRKLREELSLPAETFVIGMVAPFQPEFDHATLIKAIGELVKANPNIAVVLAGHGVQKGNAPLMALVGGGALATRVHLLGEWSDVSALYNACDVVCSSSVNDQSRMYIVMAMLCGIPVVATGIGAQGETIGQHGIAIEPGSPAAFVKALTRVLQLTPEKRTHMAQGARKHALTNYVYVRSLQKYLQLYYDLIGRQSLVTKDLPTPEVDAALTVPPALPTEAEMTAGKRKPITVVDMSEPDSLESKVTERPPEELPKWRIEQEEERNKREAEVAEKVAASKSVGDVLQVFDSQQKAATETPMTERARGVADDSEELLSQDLLETDAPATPRVSTAPAGAKKLSVPTPEKAAVQVDAAKQAALKAARMAALQPITPAPRPVAAPKAANATKPAVTRPVSSPATRPPASEPVVAQAAQTAAVDKKPDIGSTQPIEMLPEIALLESAESNVAPSNVAPPPSAEKIDLGSTQPLGTLAQELENSLLPLLELPAEVLPPASPVVKPMANAAPSAPPIQAPAAVEDGASTLEIPALAELVRAADAPLPAEKPLLAEQSPAMSEPPPSSNLTEFGELALLATGEWQAMQSSDVISEAKQDTAATGELNGPETLSLISKPAPSAPAQSVDPTIQLALLPDPAVEPKRAVNGQ
ncbi:MAG: glycosyltransferase [Pseudomonadota bacterium]|nr:glycosyltransferase [Pseudomonadota bacterium]